jgi:hypothetical protein
MTVYGLTRVKAPRAVQSRTLPPLVTPPREHYAPADEVAERRHDRNWQGERRTYCRRSRHQPVLAELRSGLERRRHNQRAADPTEHVDIEA